MCWRFVGAVAAVKLAVHLYSIEGYGIFRDELYYLACADHLDWGYVDHPALSILVLWIVKSLFGTSLFALRILPALTGTLTVIVVAATAREMNGGRVAQLIAATAVLVAPVYLSLNHTYSMNTLSLLLWATTAFLIARLVRTQNAYLWLAIAAVLALGLANKIDFLWLGAGLGVGLVLTSERTWLKTKWPWLTGLIAMSGLAPYLLWQLRHDWPTLEFVRAATTQKMAPVSILDFISGQILVMNPFTVPISIAGLVYLMMHHKGRRFQVLGWIFVTVAVILAASGTSRDFYLSPAYTALFAAGGVGFEMILSRWKSSLLTWMTITILLLGGAAAAPLALPLLPVPNYLRYSSALGFAPSTEERKEVGDLPQYFADMHGWRDIVATVIAVFESLPDDQREGVRIFAPDYGVAGAIDYYGRKAGLSPALSAHNNYWLWGPGDFDGGTLIVVGGERQDLDGLFASVELAATINCGLCMPYENGRLVWICRDFQGDFSELWPRLKHFD